MAGLHSKEMPSLKRDNGPLRSKPVPVAIIVIHAPCQPVPLLGRASRIRDRLYFVGAIEASLALAQGYGLGIPRNLLPPPIVIHYPTNRL